jgi:hypothetical protein
MRNIRRFPALSVEHHQQPPLPDSAPCQCARCEISSTRRAKFTLVRGLRKVEQLCPRCAEANSRRLAHRRLLIWSALFIGTVGLGLHTKSNESPWVIASLLLVYPLVHVVVVPHELGHALAAWLMGFEVANIQIGRGIPFWSAIVAGVEISHGSVPWGGHTRFGANCLRWYRFRFIVVCLAGPAAKANSLPQRQNELQATGRRAFRRIFGAQRLFSSLRHGHRRMLDPHRIESGRLASSSLLISRW